MRLLLLVPVVAACTSSDQPFAGEPTPSSGAYQRFVVDDYTFPLTENDAHALGSDFDNSGAPENALGIAISLLSSQADLRDDASIHALIDAGQVPSSLEIFGDTGSADQLVGLQYFGTQGSGGSVLRASTQASSAIATLDLQATTTTMLLPALVDADPTPLALDYAQMQLSPDGSGGYAVRVQALADPALATSAVCTGLLDMIANDPSQHQGMVEAIEGSAYDGSDAQSPDMTECEASSFVAAMLAPDVKGPDQKMHLSFGIALHVFAPRNVPPFE